MRKTRVCRFILSVSQIEFFTFTLIQNSNILSSINPNIVRQTNLISLEKKKTE